jgi:hypothetical protein
MKGCLIMTAAIAASGTLCAAMINFDDAKLGGLPAGWAGGFSFRVWTPR